MSLNDDERKTMVGLQMEKANRFMNQAEMVSKCSSGIWRPIGIIMLVSMPSRPCSFITVLQAKRILAC